MNALITQSSRFRAAIALAGASDPVSKYGQVIRYSGELNSIEFWYNESGQAGLGVAPWTDTARYLRNTPIAFADRVQTPLLLIHGDLDDKVSPRAGRRNVSGAVPAEQRAALVRYWGEGHVFQNPANIGICGREFSRGWTIAATSTATAAASCSGTANA